MSKTRFTRRRSTMGFDLTRGICVHDSSLNYGISLPSLIQPAHLQIPQGFGKKYKDRFSEDILHQKQRENPDILYLKFTTKLSYCLKISVYQFVAKRCFSFDYQFQQDKHIII
ncbi:hypothetical protein AVEN_184362-1 [Araneus ventricosus]|uniref:Uncharacterized protein n=1 Tax=Araneus ventricosus TaxID=182803 RepID=A0A4Y2IBY1_ARAVE|nr:hypothetical protein AVEN_184362-1 [Araneus ventricosus]